ncbi:MAG: 50S ribosomal protein L10 [Ignavibacteriae bacterium]|nr:50S ribosomal protein L10 [Ignavibacteriota bacterium]MCB9207272.1 50S ribosomal protein L10 [Ignavibacteriales bacterium]MCB9210052.1 50S ribosomal protein L10 [Ignavibacteriales bacterium]MCB9218563.1 50S ribosomal protein L10 [Ignavibacteriales bacterium]MCB9259431.1 50S ribosomal protein L10 [Ignavibacteriales bacterium]
MDKNQKVESVAQIKAMIENSTGIYLVDYQGVNVEDINQLRRGFLKENISYKVFKNTLLKRAFQEIGGYEKFEPLLVGMTGVAFSGENYVAPAKVIKKYFKEKNKFSLKGCYIESQFYGADQLDNLASMPTKEEVMASIIGSIAAPASGIVGAINAVMRDLVSVVDEISKKKAA